MGLYFSFSFSWVKQWAVSSERALGLPYVTDYMSYFPVYIYRDTFLHSREYIMKHLNVSDFEQAFRLFYFDGNWLSPVSVVLSYAWFFERDRYDWNMKLCTDLTEYNKRFPVGATIGPEHLEDILSQPQAAFHVRYREFLHANILISYCLSQEAAGTRLAVCEKHNFSLSDNFYLLHHDLQRVKELPNICTGKNTDYCLQVLDCHYKEFGLKIKQNGRKLLWSNVVVVEKLGNEIGLTCKPLLY